MKTSLVALGLAVAGCTGEVSTGSGRFSLLLPDMLPPDFKMLPDIASTEPSVPSAPDIEHTSSPAVVADFVDWAFLLPRDGLQLARDILENVQASEFVADALYDEALASCDTDLPRALIALGLLGEMKSPFGPDYFSAILAMEAPTTGEVLNGMLVAARRLELLQMKAVDGMAYYATAGTDLAVLEVVRDHPSITVRAEAMLAYQWNHGSTAQARADLEDYLRSGEAIYADVPRRDIDITEQVYDTKLAAFLEAYPEVVVSPPDGGFSWDGGLP